MKSQIYGFKIGQCENQEEYEALVKENEALYAGWREHVLPMLRANDLNARKIAAGCGISQSSAALFSRKIPAKRETVIMMAMMMHLSVAETNELLTRWARFQRLYAKHPCDAIWIYLLQKGGSDEPADLFDEYYAVFQEIQRQYLASTPPSSHRFATRIAFDAITCSAGEHAAGENSEKTSAQQDTAFRALMEKLMPSFEDAYQGLLRYLKEFFVDIEDVEDNQVGLNGAVEKHPKKRLTPNILFSDKPGVLDRYYRKMRDLENEHTLPSRLFLIALGIHLSMNTDQLNTMLELAGMGPLCPKDRLEGTIVFYLEELYCQFPTFFHPDSLEVDPVDFELQVYSSTDAGSAYVSPPEILLDFDDIPTERLSDYIKRRIEETNIFEADDEKAVKTFLEML